MNYADYISILSPNIYALYYFTKIVKFSNNTRIRRITKEFENIDSIRDFQTFMKKCMNYTKDRKLKKLVFPNSENTMYGQLRSLYDYAGLEYKETPFIHLEHGVNFSIDDVPELKFSISTVMLFQSDYKKEMIHKKDPYKPVFAIGPYIRYTKPYYDSETVQVMKEALGRTVVIYLGHTWERVSVERDIEEYKRIIREYKESFDSIIFCLYWTDCRPELVEQLQTEDKVHFVSAGYRGDPKFLARTRTILEMADMVVGNDIGTFVGYAICLGKKVQYINTNDVVKMEHVSPNVVNAKKRKQRIISAINSDNKNELSQLYNEFWGGDCLKTPQEMREILLFAEEVARKSFGLKKRFSTVTKAIIGDSDSSLLKESILTEVR